MQIAAVLTGDIVDSTRLPTATQRSIADTIREAVEAARDNWGAEALRWPAEVFRGDSWQLPVADAALSLHIAMYLRARLRTGFDGLPPLSTRIGIGLGETAVDEDEPAALGTGGAFIASGRALDRLRRGRLMSVNVAPAFAESISAACLSIVVTLVDEISQSWTSRQSRAIVGTMEGCRQVDVAATWPSGATQQAIAGHLRAAGWRPVQEALAFYEESIRGQ